MIRIDGIRHLCQDAQETLFLQRELTVIESKVYEFKTRELMYRKYVPVNNSYNEGAKSLVYKMLRKVGMFKVIGAYADDLPSADAYMTEYTNNVKSIGGKIQYSMADIRAARLANTPLIFKQQLSLF